MQNYFYSYAKRNPRAHSRISFREPHIETRPLLVLTGIVYLHTIGHTLHSKELL